MKSFALRIIRHLLEIILLILRPFVRLRIGLIHYRSLGRITGNIEYYLRCQVRTDHTRRERHLLISGKNPINHQIMKMVKRRVSVWENDFVWKWFREMQGPLPNQPGRQGKPPDHPMWLNLRHAGFLVEWDTWQEVSPQLSFTEEEHKAGRDLISILGIPEGAEYVCMHARDKAYTDSPDNIRRLDDPLAYNDFRDCDIETYQPAAQWLAEKELWVVRVGHQIVRPIHTAHSRIIDYASDYRRHLQDPEFADVYLQAHCKFFLGCTAGIYYLSHIFGVPIAFVNMIPLAESGRCEKDLWIPKKYWNKREDRFMTFKEMVERGADWNRLWYGEQKTIADEGIVFVDNTPEEILALVQEMHARLDESWSPNIDESKLQQKFRAMFPNGHPMVNFPGYVGTDFLAKNHALLG